MGRRIFKKVYNGKILEKHLSFIYDGYKLIEERDALNSNALIRSYVWQPEVLDRDVPLTVYDAVAEKTYYYHSDANKNVTELSDENGEVVAHYEYSPFGSLTKTTGAYTTSNPFRFSSEYFDEETGLVYYNYRYYNPELGRWISRDPIEEQGGFNLYGMIGNNPLHGWDKLGKELCDNCKRQQEQDYWDAFRDGFGDSLLKQFESFTGFWADLFTGKGTENWYEYGEKSAYGQAEQIGGWTEIGTKTALGVATVASLLAGGIIVKDSIGGIIRYSQDIIKSRRLNDYPANPDKWIPPRGWKETPSGQKTGGRHRQWTDENNVMRRRWDASGREAGKERGPHWHDDRFPHTHIEPNR